MRIAYRIMTITLTSLCLAGWTLPAPVQTVLLKFTPGGSDGNYPIAGLIADEEGALYGTTLEGGIGYGTVFKLTPPLKSQKTWTETVLYKFAGGADGARPIAGLITDKQGALYGTTFSGGLGSGACGASGCGTVFKLTPPPLKSQKTWTETVLYKFTGNGDGALPFAGLIADKEGTLYGTTELGGSSGYGTVFKLTPPAKNQTVWTETVLHSFTGPDGAFPLARLIADAQGALYGTAHQGGSSGYGAVFKLTAPTDGQKTWTETLLYSFKGGSSDGANPFASLIADARGALYGTTQQGGGCQQFGSGCGTVFKLTPPAYGQKTWTELVLHRFAGYSFTNPDGNGPQAGLIADKEGALYSTTEAGGTADLGTVFKLTPPANGQKTWTETLLYSFKGGPDGDDPFAGLIADKEGALYGTTSGSGSGGGGTVFKLLLCPRREKDDDHYHDRCPVFRSED